MKEIFEAFGTRLKSPLFGYSIFGFIAINWKPLFYLFMADKNVDSRILFFEQHTSKLTLFIWPISFAVFMAIAYPWINLFFLSLARFPNDFKNTLQATSEHKLLSQKQELEKMRSKALISKETELIDRAKRDQKLQSINDSEIRNKLQRQIDKLRKENDELSNKVASEEDEKEYKLESLIKTYKESLAQAEKMGDEKLIYEYSQRILRTQEELADHQRSNIH